MFLGKDSIMYKIARFFYICFIKQYIKEGRWLAGINQARFTVLLSLFFTCLNRAW